MLTTSFSHLIIISRFAPTSLLCHFTRCLRRGVENVLSETLITSAVLHQFQGLPYRVSSFLIGVEVLIWRAVLLQQQCKRLSTTTAVNVFVNV